MRQLIRDFRDSGVFAASIIMGVVLWGMSLIMWILNWIG
jgi:hypothetical protein